METDTEAVPSAGTRKISLRNSLILLRIPFSFFLSPVFFFALLCCPVESSSRAAQVFIILHILIYPASNGYNSFQDRDTGSIGGIKKPPPPDKSLFYITLLLDFIGLVWAVFLSPVFALLLLAYVLASRAYSWRGIRLKKYPVIGFLTVFSFREPEPCCAFRLASTRIFR